MAFAPTHWLAEPVERGNALGARAEPSAAADPARHVAFWACAADSGGPGCCSGVNYDAVSEASQLLFFLPGVLSVLRGRDVRIIRVSLDYSRSRGQAPAAGITYDLGAAGWPVSSWRRTSGVVAAVRNAGVRSSGSYQHNTQLNLPRSMAKMVLVHRMPPEKKVGLPVTVTQRHAWILSARKARVRWTG